MKLTEDGIHQKLYPSGNGFYLIVEGDRKLNDIEVNQLKQQILKNQEIIERLKKRIEELKKSRQRADDVKRGDSFEITLRILDFQKILDEEK